MWASITRTPSRAAVAFKVVVRRGVTVRPQQLLFYRGDGEVTKRTIVVTDMRPTPFFITGATCKCPLVTSSVHRWTIRTPAVRRPSRSLSAANRPKTKSARPFCSRRTPALFTNSHPDLDSRHPRPNETSPDDPTRFRDCDGSQLAVQTLTACQATSPSTSTRSPSASSTWPSYFAGRKRSKSARSPPASGEPFISTRPSGHHNCRRRPAARRHEIDISSLPFGVGTVKLVDCRPCVAVDGEAACLPTELSGQFAWELADPPAGQTAGREISPLRGLVLPIQAATTPLEREARSTNGTMKSHAGAAVSVSA